MTLRSVASASTYTGCLSVEHYLIDLDVKIDEDGARAACQQSIYDMNIDVDGAQAVSIVYLSIYLSIQLESGGGAREKEREREREKERCEYMRATGYTTNGLFVPKLVVYYQFFTVQTVY